MNPEKKQKKQQQWNLNPQVEENMLCCVFPLGVCVCVSSLQEDEIRMDFNVIWLYGFFILSYVPGSWGEMWLYGLNVGCVCV